MNLNKLYLWIRKNVLGIDDRSQLEIAIENGMVVGKNHKFQDGIIFDPSHCWLITIGDNVTIAPRVHILCHDASTKSSLGYTKVGTVSIGDNVFIGANSTILPNVRIGNNCVIGANSVVTHDIPANSVAVGNPCIVRKTYEEYIEENKELMKRTPKYDKDYLIGNISDNNKKKMQDELKNTIGFIV